MTQRKSADTKVVPIHRDRVSVQFWVSEELREAYRGVVERQDLRVAQALRHHMAEVVASEEAA